MYLLHLAALVDGLTWLFWTTVLKIEGVLTMLCLHVFLFGQSNLRQTAFSARLVQAAASAAFTYTVRRALC